MAHFPRNDFSFAPKWIRRFFQSINCCGFRNMMLLYISMREA